MTKWPSPEELLALCDKAEQVCQVIVDDATTEIARSITQAERELRALGFMADSDGIALARRVAALQEAAKNLT